MSKEHISDSTGTGNDALAAGANGRQLCAPIAGSLRYAPCGRQEVSRPATGASIYCDSGLSSSRCNLRRLRHGYLGVRKYRATTLAAGWHDSLVQLLSQSGRTPGQQYSAAAAPNASISLSWSTVSGRL